MIYDSPLCVSRKVVKFLVESSGVQHDFNANFLHLLSIGWSMFWSGMSLIKKCNPRFLQQTNLL